jgi:DNA-binding MurR/RpiR family transcriptional regulator
MRKMGETEGYTNVLKVIRSKYENFSGTYKKVADFILGNLERATFAPLDELSREIGLSDATLIRFARELGFAGYPELRQNLVSYIRAIIYPSKKTDFFVEGIDTSSVLENTKTTDIEFINRTINNIPQDSFEQLIHFIVSHNRIFVMGWGISSFLAEFLTLQLQRMSYSATAIIRERRPLIERMIPLRKGDLLIVFDFLEYSVEVLEAIEYLHDNSPTVKLVSFTSDSAAPIAQYADLKFICGTITPMISLTAPICLINGIVLGVLSIQTRKARAAVSRFQNVVLRNSNHYLQLERQGSPQKGG